MVVMTPEQPLPLSVVPSTLVQSQNKSYACIVGEARAKP
jgi:hypothetical protein